jgi:hypothetical protein
MFVSKIKSSLSKLVSTRRSTVQNLSLQKGFFGVLLPHRSVLWACDVTEVAIEAEVEADVAAGKADHRAPEEMGGGHLVEEVVVDDIGHEGELHSML